MKKQITVRKLYFILMNHSHVTFNHICTIKQTWQIPVMAVSYIRWRIARFNNNLYINPL